MRAGQVEVVGRLPYSSNRTFLTRCCDDQGETPAVYKPVAGERPLYDFPEETLYRREVAAHLVDAALGWGFVPLTIARDDLPLGPGSLQLFVDHDPEQHYFTLLEGHRATFQRLAVFDILTNNADRKGGHCLLGDGGHVWAIDNGLTFNVEPKLRTVIWDFAGEPLPSRERAAIGGLAKRLKAADDPLRRELDELLQRDEVEALQRRAKALQQPGVFPHPDSSWSFPWPLV
ncbi:MAG: SCO1664 family protein [Candidatus Dormiibacterota bacterium]